MIFRPSRERGSERFVELRGVLLLTGAGFGLAGMLSERNWLVYVGIAILALGIVVRLINRRKNESESDEE